MCSYCFIAVEDKRATRSKRRAWKSHGEFDEAAHPLIRHRLLWLDGDESYLYLEPFLPARESSFDNWNLEVESVFNPLEPILQSYTSSAIQGRQFATYILPKYDPYGMYCTGTFVMDPCL